MAERTVSVRLRALVDDYKRAMGEAANSTTDVVKKADSFKQLGQSTAALGASLTRNVTLPIVGIGVAAGKLAVDFDQTFAQMKGLAGVAADEVDGLKEAVLGLAGETGRGPQELAEALYFIRSSGLAGKDALDALDVSARAAASGLGSTVQVADAVTSAMNAYAKSGLTASEATDVLVATAREGKAEPAELAAQMGRLVPVAAELGISFQDVGASIATISLVGNDAATSTTQLSNVMSKLLKPSNQAAELLSSVGLEVEDLRGLIAEKGLLGTLEELKNRLGDSGFTKFLEDTQAIQGALALTGGDIEATRARFEALNESTGASAEAFEQTDSAARDLSKAWAEMQVALIKVGSIIAPLAADLANLAATAISAFGDLPAPIQNAIVVLGGLAAAVGPSLFVFGKLTSAFSTLVSTLVNFAVPNSAIQGLGSLNTGAATATSAMGRLATTLVTAATNIGLLMAAGELLDQVMPRASADINELENALLKLGQTGNVTGPLEKLGDDFGDLKSAIDEIADPSNVERVSHMFDDMLGPIGTDKLPNLRKDIDEIDKALAQLAQRDPDEAAASLNAVFRLMDLSKEKADAFRGMLDDYASALAALDTAEATSETEELGGAMEDQAGATGEALSALQSYSEHLTAMFDPLFGMVDALHANEEAQRGVIEAQTNLDAVRADSESTAEDAAQAEREYNDALGETGPAALGVAQASLALSQAVQDGTVSFDEAKDMLDLWVRQGIFTQQQADHLAASFFGAAGAADAYAGDYAAHISAPGAAESISTVAQLREQLNSVDGRHARATVTTEFIQVGRIGQPFRFHEGGVVPGARGREVAAVLLGQEEVLAYDDPRHSANMTRLSGPMTAASGGFGGPSTTVLVDMRGAIVASKSDARRWVAEAWNSAADKGLVNVKGRRV